MTRNKIIPYNNSLKLLARDLRKNSTLGEVYCGKGIQSRKLGYQFHRQVLMENYIFDFFCHEFILAIEIDGITHYAKHDLDRIIQRNLENLGFIFCVSRRRILGKIWMG
jgi:very-short-patch-repair endonuclease